MLRKGLQIFYHSPAPFDEPDLVPETPAPPVFRAGACLFIRQKITGSRKSSRPPKKKSQVFLPYFLKINSNFDILLKVLRTVPAASGFTNGIACLPQFLEKRKRIFHPDPLR